MAPTKKYGLTKDRAVVAILGELRGICVERALDHGIDLQEIWSRAEAMFRELQKNSSSEDWSGHGPLK